MAMLLGYGWPSVWPLSCRSRLRAETGGQNKGVISLDAIGPPVVTQKRAILVDQVAEPGQHDAHVVERHSLHILLLHALLGSAEGAVDRLHEIRMLVRKFAGHHHGMHDRKNAGASVVIALHGFIILEQPSDLRRAFENCLRGIG